MIFIGVTDKQTIIETLARERRVEALVENIAHHSLTADLKDLCQMVYLILLEYDEDKLQDLWENEQINFFLARVIINQYRSSNSPFHTIFRKYQERSYSLGSEASVADYRLEYLKRNENAPDIQLLSDELIPMFRNDK